MKFKYVLSLLSILLLTYQAKSQNRISIQIPTAEEEAEYIWQNLQDIDFFEKNNYQLSLPQGPLIEELKQKAKLKELTGQDLQNLKDFMCKSVYREADYQQGYQEIKQELSLMSKMFIQLSQLELNGYFKEFEIYQVTLTLYGPGGSYDSDEGSILIFTTPDGKFKNYANPAYTLIHEITHIGIEDAIVQTYQVPHAMKERIVDTFVSLSFGQYLPDYRIQDMGETRTDQYLQSIADLWDLAKIVEGILQ